MYSTTKRIYVTDLIEFFTISRRKKSPVVATELLYVNGQLEKKPPLAIWFNSSCLLAYAQ